jgi:hypothetical protein
MIMRRHHLGQALVLTATVVAITALPASARPSPTAGRTAPWKVQLSPNASSDFNQLDGVVAVAAKDVWAVGFARNPQTSVYRTLVEHYDGTAWRVVSSPNQGGNWNFLNSAAAVSANDVWAVGRVLNGSFLQPLTEHWNGSAWTVVPSPTVGGAHTQLMSVAALSSTDVWAVGLSQVPLQHPLTLTEHWDGSAWSIVPSPSPVTDAMLFGVSAVSSNDVWAVGSSQGNDVTLAEHWDGETWSVVSTPLSPSGVLYSAVALAANDVWAVGIGGSATLAEHWNGRRWSVTSTPNPGGQTTSSLNAVDVVSAHDVWAAGYAISLGVTGTTLTEHWDGTAWSIVASPNRGHNDPSNRLFGLAALPSGALWTVGDYTKSYATTPRTLILSAGA